jgi:hypothetical protein
VGWFLIRLPVCWAWLSNDVPACRGLAVAWLPMTLAFAAMAPRPTAVLTGPRPVIAAPRPDQSDQPANTCNMTGVRLEQCPLTAAAGLVWSGDLPRQLQQLLFDAADGITV